MRTFSMVCELSDLVFNTDKNNKNVLFSVFENSCVLHEYEGLDIIFDIGFVV